MSSSKGSAPLNSLTLWEIGPYHASLPAPMRLQLGLDGEMITSCVVDTGYLHRGLEKAIELHPWAAAITYADHLDPEGAIFGELVLCLAVEEIADVKVPPRAQWIRMILAELTKISANLNYIVRVAKSVGSETIVHYVLRDREKILDLFELLTGARFSINFLRFGGVSSDVTDGFIERVIEVCELIRIRVKEYNDIFTFNHIFLKRSQGVGILSPQLVRECGITGPNARASGIAMDFRKDYPYLIYKDIDFKVIIIQRDSHMFIGDVHARFLIRLKEMIQSTEILKQICETIPSGDFIQSKWNKKNILAGEAYCRIESSRGLLGCHAVSDGRDNPSRIQFRVPTVGNLMALPGLISGTRIEDLPVVLASLDLGIAEADR